MDEHFWAEQAASIDWFQPWHTFLDWNPPYAQWYLGGKLNACYNALDRQDRTLTALIWENEKGESATWTYGKLLQEVERFAYGLKSLGIQKGDTVALYMPMIPQAIVAMLACARIGAIHNVVFAGFSAPALRDRLIDSDAKLLITADGTHRAQKVIPLKEAADRAADGILSKMVVVQNTQHPVSMGEEHIWYHELMAKGGSYPCESMDAEAKLFYLYTSGTTGKPKGVVHTTGGYMVGVTQTCRRVFDLKPKDLFWCTADIGWITGHSYVVYGPLSTGATIFIYEGAIQQETCWRLIEKYGIQIFYTAPTAIRMFMQWGESFPEKYNLSSLKLLGSVGEPLNPEAWEWYHLHIGKNRCPIMDTWWQTETGSIMISPTPSTPLKPGSATHPLPGVSAEIREGALVLTSPWPSMLRGIHNDPERYEKTYWKDGVYITGDSARQDEEGYFWLLGRNDDVINISGHRLGSAEIESALVDYPSVAEAAVIAVPHQIKGESIFAFVVERNEAPLDRDYESTLKQHIAQKISPIARPEKVIKVSELPKTRSGKIMRRLLKNLIEGKEGTEVSTLSNPDSLEKIKESL